MAAELVAPPSRPVARLQWRCRLTVWRCIMCLPSRSAQARNDGASPLYLAACNGQTKAVELLLKAGANVNQVIAASVGGIGRAGGGGRFLSISFYVYFPFLPFSFQKQIKWPCTQVERAGAGGHFMLFDVILRLSEALVCFRVSGYQG